MSRGRSDKQLKRQRRQRKEQGRRSQRSRHLEVVDRQSEEPDLIASIGAALSQAHPLRLIELVSALMNTLDTRNLHPTERRPAKSDEMTLERFLNSFIEIDLPETTAVLTVASVMLSDELQAARMRRAVASRQHAMPGWLGRLSGTTSYRAVEMVHVLGDGDDVILGVRLPTGHEISAVIYIDHNMGGVVKDAFVVDEEIGTLIALMQLQIGDPDTTWTDLDLGDARARVEEAVVYGAITFPPFETDTWPMSRPLVEWLVRGLPSGGKGYVRPEWSTGDIAQLTEDFFSSEYGVAVDSPSHRHLMQSILWFGTDWGPGDPLRWSPVNVEMLLSDWIPRKVYAEVAELTTAPDMLRAFIRYCHQRQGIRLALTTETLEAVDLWEPEYQRIIRSPRAQGVDALFEAMDMPMQREADEPGALLDLDAAMLDFNEYMLSVLCESVGGEETLRTLDERPLPDEAFDWTGIPDDVHDRVSEVLRLCDSCCEQLLDSEFRTACRRFLARVAVGDPNIFRRRGATRTAAAAVCWVIGRANNLFGPDLLVRDLLGFFEVSSASQRASTFLSAAGIDP
ncbi:MAG: hypothetical protein H0V49_05590 [Nocardioidaceae bacterium]|nr:hypothetical protein [Nocardioidaceae bacterium]